MLFPSLLGAIPYKMAHIEGKCTPLANLPLDQAAQQQANAQQLHGLAIGTISGTFSHSKAFGLESAGVRAQPDRTMFRWASISKTLVGLVASLLARAGVVELDADIRQYYADYPLPTHYLQCAYGAPAATKYPGNGGHPNHDCLMKVKLPRHRRLTLRLLLSHRAGMPHYHNGEKNPKPPSAEANNPHINTGMSWALEKYLAPLALVAPPGAIYSYSTFGFNLAAETLARAANRSFANLVQSLIAIPCCLSSIRPDYEWQRVPHRATGWSANGSAVISEDVSWKLGGGGFISTLNDLLRLGRQMQITEADGSCFPDDTKFSPSFGVWTERPETVLKPAACATTGGRQCMQYSMGWSSLWLNHTLHSAHHSGSTVKARTDIVLQPCLQGVCVHPRPASTIVMSNSQNANTFVIAGALQQALEQQGTLNSSASCVSKGCKHSK